MALQLLIGGTDRTSALLTNSLEITDDLRARNGCSFSLVMDGSWQIELGAHVVVRDGSVVYFAGTIDQFESERMPGTGYRKVRVTAVDYNQLADRRVVAKVFENMTAGQIVRELVATYLAADGVTNANVQEGPVIEKAVFDYITVAEALDELATLTGYRWNIDYSKGMHFFDQTTYTAPWSVTESSDIQRVRFSRTRQDYRNRQIVRGGDATTDVRTETFTGDGSRRTFTLQYPVKTMIELKVNGVQQVVAVQGTPGAQWYYQVGSADVTQATSEPVLQPTDILSVTYQGGFPVLAVVDDTAGIDERKAIEGGSGLYEAVETDPNLDTNTQAQQKAQGLLALYKYLPRILEFETDRPGLASGQLLPINLPFFGINDTFLIHQVTISDVDGQFLRWRVRAVGSELPGWVKWWQALVKSTKRTGKFTINEQAIVVVYSQLPQEGITGNDVLAATLLDPGRSEVGFAEVGLSEVS